MPGDQKSAEDFEIPLTLAQKWEPEFEKNPGLDYAPNSKKWFDAELNAKLTEDYWSVPYDARFPQTRKNRMCFTYFVDYHRCLELKGEDYKPCQYFKNVYEQVCPRFWVEKWDEQVDEGRFPARFDK